MNTDTPRDRSQPLVRSDLAELLCADRHHALLLAGQAGLGQVELALHLIRAWLCESDPSGRAVLQASGGRRAHDACGHCQSCRWIGTIDAFEDGYSPQHPDLLWLRPEADDPLWEPAPHQAKTAKPSRVIKIDQVRASAGFVTVGAQRSRGKFVLLSPAEAMQAESANSLLKMLEEPAGECRFILVTEHPDWLLPTIRSRCRLHAMRVPGLEENLAWLQAQDVPADLARELLALTGDAAHAALRLVRRNQSTTHRLFIDGLAGLPESSLTQVVTQLAAIEAPMVARLFQAWTADLILAKLGQPVRFFPGQLGVANQRVRQTSLHALLALESDWRSLPRLAEHPLHPRLFIEGLLLRYSEIFS